MKVSRFTEQNASEELEGRKSEKHQHDRTRVRQEAGDVECVQCGRLFHASATSARRERLCDECVRSV
ncbi:MAG: hypothetical protein BGO03_11645 [Mesorhizobium sp. 61-13]|nr:MAG: hypothetical protein BGO03_11645 [Mesorhizobium sp. 61-13]